MTSAEIRQSFLDFFKERGHEIVLPASLMPAAPNLLFTNAGMNQFVPYFLGERDAPRPRVADTQKCIRAGGKHNDLEDVGFDTYHHTFFEMLGNWSFGDYFKEEALNWSWELLTKVWKMPKERLYAAVYKPRPGDPAEFDQEACDIWADIFRREGMDPKVHIKSSPDNFWMMGNTGPCGPCSEIHMDLTEKGDTGGKLVDADSPYCIELWNNVFIQFNALPDGTFEPLKKKHVDTGMGFERVAGIFAFTKNFTDFSNAPSNYESDLFTDFFAKLTELSGHVYQSTLPEDRGHLSEAEMKDCAFRVIADHLRCLSCAIADGILPGNTDRNYVLRRILRRAVLWANRIGLEPGSLAGLSNDVAEKLGPVFPELTERREVIRKAIASEEESFNRTLGRGISLFNEEADRLSGPQKELPGEFAFKLYDTYGFPLDLTQLMARERGLTVDVEGFNKLMEEQRERARASQKKETIITRGIAPTGVTKFVGYNNENLVNFETKLIGEQNQGGRTTCLIFSETPFYAEKGGQVGDVGFVEIDGDCIEIIDTVEAENGDYYHKVDIPVIESVEVKPVKLSVNISRRLAIQRHHTGTHVLHWALREVLGKHVRQAGSYVGPDRFRFDFSHFEQPAPEQLKKIEELANERILQNDPVKACTVPFDEKPEDTLAFFGEKYGNEVRVLEIGGWSRELCGGTHVSATGEIGLLKVVSESAIAAGTRRIEAVAGLEALELARSQFDFIQEMSRSLSCKPGELEQRFAGLLERSAALEKELKSKKRKDARGLADDLAADAKQARGFKFAVAKAEAANPNELRNLAVQVSKKLGPGVVVLGGVFGEKVTVLALCSKEAIEAGHKAGEIVRNLAGELGGKGGGKPDFAMGGGRHPEKLDQVLKDFLEQTG